MQILKENVFKKVPLYDFSSSLCGHAVCLGLAVELKIWDQIEF